MFDAWLNQQVHISLYVFPFNKASKQKKETDFPLSQTDKSITVQKAYKSKTHSKNNNKN